MKKHTAPASPSANGVDPTSAAPTLNRRVPGSGAGRNIVRTIEPQARATSIVFAGKRFVRAADNTAVVYDTATWKTVSQLKSDPLRGVGNLSDGSAVVATQNDDGSHTIHVLRPSKETPEVFRGVLDLPTEGLGRLLPGGADELYSARKGIMGRYKLAEGQARVQAAVDWNSDQHESLAAVDGGAVVYFDHGSFVHRKADGSSARFEIDGIRGAQHVASGGSPDTYWVTDADGRLHLAKAAGGKLTSSVAVAVDGEAFHLAAQGTRAAVVVGSQDEDSTNERWAVVVVGNDGKVLWRHPLKAPTLSGQNDVFVAMSSSFVAVNSSSGFVVWEAASGKSIR